MANQAGKKNFEDQGASQQEIEKRQPYPNGTEYYVTARMNIVGDNEGSVTSFNSVVADSKHINELQLPNAPAGENLEPAKAVVISHEDGEQGTQLNAGAPGNPDSQSVRESNTHDGEGGTDSSSKGLGVFEARNIRQETFAYFASFASGLPQVAHQFLQRAERGSDGVSKAAALDESAPENNSRWATLIATLQNSRELSKFCSGAICFSPIEVALMLGYYLGMFPEALEDSEIRPDKLYHYGDLDYLYFNLFFERQREAIGLLFDESKEASSNYYTEEYPLSAIDFPTIYLLGQTIKKYLQELSQDGQLNPSIIVPLVKGRFGGVGMPNLAGGVVQPGEIHPELLQATKTRENLGKFLFKIFADSLPETLKGLLYINADIGVFVSDNMQRLGADGEPHLPQNSQGYWAKLREAFWMLSREDIAEAEERPSGFGNNGSTKQKGEPMQVHSAIGIVAGTVDFYNASAVELVDGKLNLEDVPLSGFVHVVSLPAGALQLDNAFTFSPDGTNRYTVSVSKAIPASILFKFGITPENYNNYNYTIAKFEDGSISIFIEPKGLVTVGESPQTNGVLKRDGHLTNLFLAGNQLFPTPVSGSIRRLSPEQVVPRVFLKE